MANALLENLRAEWAGLRTQVEEIERTAAESNRDLEEPEQANVDALVSRAEQLRPRIEHLVGQEAGFSATAEALSRVTQGGGTLTTRRDEASVEVLRAMYPTAGHYVSDLMVSKGNVQERKSQAPEAQARIARATEIARALANQTTADNPGILPTPIVGDVVNLIDASRPVWNSFTQRPMPASGKTFQRPKIAQHTQVAKQTAEKAAVASQKMVISPITLTKDTYAGAVDISVQDVDWTDPSILQIVIQDLGDIYAVSTDAAASALIGAVTQAQDLPAAATSAQWLSSLYGAAGLVYAGSKRLPDTLWASVDQWARVGSAVNSDGDALFPNMGVNTDVSNFAGNPLGLRLVVGPNLPAGTLVMGASRFAEAYEDRKGAVRAFEVSLLGWEVGFYGYAVAALIEPLAFVKIHDVP